MMAPSVLSCTKDAAEFTREAYWICRGLHRGSSGEAGRKKRGGGGLASYKGVQCTCRVGMG